MTQWIQLSADDLNRYLAAAQVEALRTVSLAGGQPDPLPGILADVTQRVRAEIAANPRNRLSADETLLPPELKGAAVVLAAVALQGRIPPVRLTRDQDRAGDNARRLLRRVADGDIAISMPEDPAPAGTHGSGASFCGGARARTAGGDNLNGL